MLLKRQVLRFQKQQNNKILKGAGGATPLLNRKDEPALIRCQLSAPELSKILVDFENENFPDYSNNSEKIHHESTQKFQDEFRNDVKKLSGKIDSNPFKMDALTALNNCEVLFEENVYHKLPKLLPFGTKQVLNFISTRLMTSQLPITAKISLNHFT